MAQANDMVKLDVTVLEKSWIKVALQQMRKSRVRARDIEAPGSEIYALRTKEIEQLERLVDRL